MILENKRKPMKQQKFIQKLHENEEISANLGTKNAEISDSTEKEPCPYIPDRGDKWLH